MNAKRILIAMMMLAIVGLAVNQWQLQRALNNLTAAAPTASRADNSDSENTAAKLRQTEAQLNETKTKLQIADAKLANAGARIAQLDQRLRQLEGGRGPRKTFSPVGEVPELEPADEPPTNGVKRSWGPEQATGEPDTLQSGDIPTAWASLQPDAGEEWLQLEYERAVDIAEVRVRETYNPGAVSKVTAILPNGSEITLWEGTEPAVAAPVEMSFQVTSSVTANRVKVYLDTKRVPGWNEIDAVELIGREGSHQWAKHATASSTFAQPRGGGLGNRLIELEGLQESTIRRL